MKKGATVKAFIMLLLVVAMTGWLGVPDGNAQPTLYVAASEALEDQGGFPVTGASSLHRVNPQTGRATLVGAIGFDAVGGMAFHPLTGVLYAVGQRPSAGAEGPRGARVLITIDPATGAGAEIGPFDIGPLEIGPPPGLEVRDLAFRPNGVLYATVANALLTVNLGTGAGTFISFPCCLVQLGTIDSLTFSADGSVGFSRRFEATFIAFDPETGVIFDGTSLLAMRDTTGAVVGVLDRLDGLDTEPGTGRLWGVINSFGTSACPSGGVTCLVTIEPTPDPVPDNFVATQGPDVRDAIGNHLGLVLALAWSPGAPNTPLGAHVPVQLGPALVTFEMVTQAGTTTVTTSATGPPLLASFSLGTPPTYFDVATTALFSGFVDVCIQYAGIAFGNEASLRLLHFDGAAFADVTTSLDTTNDVICGRSFTLSPFVVVERAQSVAEMLVDLLESIRGRALPAAFEARLVAALESALADPRRVSVTCGALQRFIGLVRFAQTIRLIPAVRATQWIDDTEAIRAALGC